MARTNGRLISTKETHRRKPPVDVEEEVRLRAYELYEQRGKEDGHDIEDWLQAEFEIIQQSA